MVPLTRIEVVLCSWPLQDLIDFDTVGRRAADSILGPVVGKAGDIQILLL